MQKGVELVGQFCRRGLRSELLEAIENRSMRLRLEFMPFDLTLNKAQKKPGKPGFSTTCDYRCQAPGSSLLIVQTAIDVDGGAGGETGQIV
jgi:hypothetical protein